MALDRSPKYRGGLYNAECCDQELDASVPGEQVIGGLDSWFVIA